MTTALFVVLAAALGAIVVRLGYLIQEVFLRLDQIEKSLSDKLDKDDDDDAVNSSSQTKANEKLVALAKELEASALTKVRRYRRFSALMKLWVFLSAARVRRVPDHMLEHGEILRFAQRIVSNPWRQYHHGLAVDRWGRSADVRLPCHGLSSDGAFWYVVNTLESYGHKFENPILDLLEQTLSVSELLLKEHIFDSYVRMVAQYELAIRASYNEEANAFIQRYMSATDSPERQALNPLRHALLHSGRD
jgi:hypothetical protein